MPIWDWMTNALGRTKTFGLATVFGLLMIALIQIWAHLAQELSPDRPPMSPNRQGMLDFGLSMVLVVLATGIFTAAGIVLKNLP